MITDSLKNASLYYSVNPRFERAFAWLASVDTAAIEPGKYEIDGKEIFASVVDKELKKPEDAKLEVHDKYIDIQIIVRGEETFGWSERCACTEPKADFDSEKDIQFFLDKPQTCYTLRAGQFTILFPEDAHAPMIGEGTVKKVILKIKA
ncbi:MAG: YhcH/YjgK/YiaL family protein [Alistipes sp.]|nr:YhcH/YjgK/YiaL family protein [Alistipes sp.]